MRPVFIWTLESNPLWCVFWFIASMNFAVGHKLCSLVCVCVCVYNQLSPSNNKIRLHHSKFGLKLVST